MPEQLTLDPDAVDRYVDHVATAPSPIVQLARPDVAPPCSACGARPDEPCRPGCETSRAA